MSRAVIIWSIILSSVALSACANTVRGVRTDVVQTGKAASGR